MATLLAIFLAFPSIHVAHSLAINSSSLQHASTTPVLLTAASVDAADIITSCKDLDSSRSLYSIIQTCVATIFACVWVAVHRNIPVPRTTPKRSSNVVLKAAQWVWSKISDQKESFVVFTVTLLAPEWVLAWAVRQALRARRLEKELEEARETAKRTWEEIDSDQSSRNDGLSLRSSSGDDISTIKKQLDKSVEWARARSVGKSDQKWTKTHAFYVIMGGYHASDESGPLYPLTSKEVISVVEAGKLTPPTDDELSNQSKGDFLSKGIAILQTLWFVVQCIARLAEHLPLTHLEVMTLAYTVITMAMYVAWWNKPLNISCATRVPGTPMDNDSHKHTYEGILMKTFQHIVGNPDNLVYDLHSFRRVPTFWAGKPNANEIANADLIALLAAMAFGAVHCIAWFYTFSYHLEIHLWRISAIAIVAIPAATLMVLPLAVKSDRSFLSTLGEIFAVIACFVGGPIYIAARMILLVLSFTTLNSLPYSVYQTVQWTDFIPHI